MLSSNKVITIATFESKFSFTSTRYSVLKIPSLLIEKATLPSSSEYSKFPVPYFFHITLRYYYDFNHFICDNWNSYSLVINGTNCYQTNQDWVFFK